MPEGAEVECLTRQLRPLLEGNRIVDGRSYHERFTQLPEGRVERVFRHGKWINLQTADGVVRINLGMSGRFVRGNVHPKHVRWAILVDVGGRKVALRYVDPRGFGRLELRTGKLALQMMKRSSPTTGIAALGLGPDVMSRYLQEDMGVGKLTQILSTSKPIKLALLDQSRIAGIGNIYACEICYAARVHPACPAQALSARETSGVLAAMRKILPLATSMGGTSFGDANTFRDLEGREGRFITKLQVYGREGLKCRRGHVVQNMKLGGRSTFFCPVCQR